MKRLRVIVLGLVTGLAACNKGPSEDQCHQLLDHLVDLEFNKSGAAKTDATKAEVARQKKEVAAKMLNDFTLACTDKTAKARVDCALAAGDIDKGVAACDK